jgi:hypothetical protein
MINKLTTTRRRRRRRRRGKGVAVCSNFQDQQ